MTRGGYGGREDVLTGVLWVNLKEKNPWKTQA